MAQELAQRVGGIKIVKQLTELAATGWSDEMVVDIARVCVDSTQELKANQLAAARVGGKRNSVKAGVVAALRARKGLWKEAADAIPALSGIATRLLCVHPTSCATERNWELWGRVYTSARPHL